MGVPGQIIALVKRFKDNENDYKSEKYNEAQLRQEFINPFFESLGWDINNRKGYAEIYKEVIHEDSIKVKTGGTKAPDYCFRSGGIRKFFVEAKKPSVNIYEESTSAYQLRRYGYSANLPVSILTNFDVFAIYNCRNEPLSNDPATKDRILCFTYKEYIERWEELFLIFSHDALHKGLFDKYVESKLSTKGTVPVDKAFLNEIESWREALAINIALRNSQLTEKELNFAVQITIDRIIFLRICEDRGIETYGRLMSLLTGTESYARLLKLFSKADYRYNSGLFHFDKEDDRHESPDEITPRLQIDDDVLKKITRRLYPPESPYEFSVLPADILGQIYEQFLGKVVRLTKVHRAVVEYKPELKKSGGIYYTPSYIVQYIVQTTLGSLVGMKSHKTVDKLKVVDPACGSGSFLIIAYQYLLDWYLSYYTANNPKKWDRAKKLYKSATGDWKLTTHEKKRILLNSIYGVDIDSQAVEVTKLSLLLKVLEGESEQTLLRQDQFFFDKRVLPDLGNNIKCGNSLVGADFSDDGTTQAQSFIWDQQFDVVIGNPPYVRQEMLSAYKDYFAKKYTVFEGSADLYVYFIEQGFSLLKNSGMLGYLVSNKWLRAKYGKNLRDWLRERCIEEIVDFGDLPVFKNATTYPCILKISNKNADATFSTTQVETLDFTRLEKYVEQNKYKVEKKFLDSSGWALSDSKTRVLLNKLINTGISLGEYVKGQIYRGVLTGLNEAFVVDKTTKDQLIKQDSRSAEIIKPFLAGKDIKRYQPPLPRQYIIFTRRGIQIQEYPAILDYLSKFKDRLTPMPKNWKGKWKGRKQGNYQWYEIQDTVDYYQEFEKPKIIVPCITKNGCYSFDNNRFYSNDKTNIIPLEDYYLLGILNSRTIDFVMHLIASTKRGGYFEYKPMYIKKMPIPNSSEKIQEELKDMVEQMLYLHKNGGNTNTIDKIEQQIDALVYQLYRLTDKEIGLIEKELSR